MSLKTAIGRAKTQSSPRNSKTYKARGFSQSGEAFYLSCLFMFQKKCKSDTIILQMKDTDLKCKDCGGQVKLVFG
jgi:hypothetical protein